MEQEKSAEFILDRVQTYEDDNRDQVSRQNYWHNMYEGKGVFGNRTREQALAEGQEQIVTPEPYNVVNKACSLVLTDPKIEMPPADATELSTLYAEACEKWLSALWQQVNYQQHASVIGMANLYNFALGEHVFEMKWLNKKEMPKLLRASIFPISIRVLDPRNVGIHRANSYIDWAFHKYETTLADVLGRYPSLREKAKGTKLEEKLDKYLGDGKHRQNDRVSLIDYWCLSDDYWHQEWDEDEEDSNEWDDGRSVLNALLIDDCLIEDLSKTKYPVIPYVGGKANTSLDGRGNSILRPLEDLWEHDCLLLSQQLTGLARGFWPHTLVSNEHGTPVDDIMVGPGRTTHVPWGTKIEEVKVNPDIGLSDIVRAKLDAHRQQGTFAPVMYGDPGAIQAGYPLNILSKHGEGTVKPYIQPMEMSLSYVHMVVLAMVEGMAGPKGVTIWGKDERDRQTYRLTLNKSMINSYYDNRVTLLPNLPQDEMARQAAGAQLVSQNIITRQSYYDGWLGNHVPSDEERRRSVQMALDSPEMGNFVKRQALIDYFGLEKAAPIIEEAGWAPLPPTPPAPTMGPPPGPPMGPPPSMSPQGPPSGNPMVPPPPMMGQGGPMPPPGAPIGPPPPMFPPDQGMGMAPGGAMPPMGGGGMPPEMMGGPPMGGPPMGTSPQLGMGPLDLQPPSIGGPQNGGGIPPTMQAQMEPEMLGLPPVGAPLDFAALTGQGFTPEQLQEYLMQQGL